MCAYSSASDVSALCQNIINTEDGFTTSTSPTLTEVNSWLTSGCAIIESRLSSAGYSVPPSATTAVYGWLAELNTNYAVSRAEMSRTNIILGMGERTRGQLFEKAFWEGLDRLLKMDLSIAGLTKSNDAVLYAGGISISDKDIYDSDTDRVPGRFRRGQFDFPGTIRAGDTISAS